MPKPVLFAELFDEIISYLWNDSQSLESSSLANKVMIVPCQRRLFHRIALMHNNFRFKSDGTSANFFQLLTESPHIAGYVKSLFIYDHISYRRGGFLLSESIESGDPLDAPMVAYTESEEDFRRRQWLPQDKYLPDFAPLLCNLRALTISYTGKWKHLSFRVFSSLVHMMQLPSLLYVGLEKTYPDCIFDLAIGENVKHLSLDAHHDESVPVHQLSHLPSGPVFIESLFTSSSRPTHRIRTRCLRKLVLGIHEGDENETQAFLECCDALEDLEVIVLQNPSPSSIGLDKLTTLARFTASLGFATERFDGSLKTNMSWLCQVLQSGSTLVNQALREITIGVACYYGNDYYSISEWKKIFNILDRYSNLAVLTITIAMKNASGETAGEKLFNLLDTCDDVGRLRTQQNVDSASRLPVLSGVWGGLIGYPGETWDIHEDELMNWEGDVRLLEIENESFK